MLTCIILHIQWLEHSSCKKKSFTKIETNLLTLKIAVKILSITQFILTIVNVVTHTCLSSTYSTNNGRWGHQKSLHSDKIYTETFDEITWTGHYQYYDFGRCLLSDFKIKILCAFLPVKMFLNASSTFVESNADVSINESVFFSNTRRDVRHLRYAQNHTERTLFGIIVSRCDLPANARASSVGTALRCRRSLLFPTSIMTMLLSAWSLSSFNQRSTFSYVRCFAIS